MLRRLLAAVILAAAMVSLAATGAVRSGEEGLLVVVTFPNLADDLRLLLCSGDRVVSLVPRGVDPHSYQLSPRDMDLLARADLIVSTGHAAFEEEIRRRVEEGGFRGVLVEIPRIPGVEIAVNPATGTPNYHMPIYDPGNYEVFLRYVASVLAGLRPECRDAYMRSLEGSLRRLREVVLSAPRLDVEAVGDTPLTQYAVSWLGVRLRYLVIKEHGVAATPQDLSRIEEALREGRVGLAVAVSPPASAASRSLVSMAGRHGVPVLYVPSPLSEGSMIDKLAVVAQHARLGTGRLGAARRAGGALGRGISGLALAGLVAFVAAASMAVLLRERRGMLEGVDWALILLGASSLALLAALGAEVEARWVVVMASAALAYGFLSPVIAARRLYFLAGASPHAALLAAVFAIPLSSILGFGERVWAVIIGLALTYAIGYMIHRGLDPDTSTAVFVAFTASASVLAIYYVLTHYPRETDIMAIVVGDPLLASWAEAGYAVAVAAASALILGLTYREQVCIGVERDSVKLTGIRVAVYDFLAFTMLAASTVVLIRIVGFVLEHVLILLPAAIASTAMLGALRSLVASVNISLFASLLGLWLAVRLDLAPAGLTGMILFAVYLALLIYSRRRWA